MRPQDSPNGAGRAVPGIPSGPGDPAGLTILHFPSAQRCLSCLAILLLLFSPKYLPGQTALRLVDLSDQISRRIVVDREPGQYLGHPTTVLLEDGRTITAVYPKGHGRGPIVMKRSSNGGLTWSDRLAVPENWATSLETPTIHCTVDLSGKKRLIPFSGLYQARIACFRGRVS